MMIFPLFIRFHTSQVVQDFFDQQYEHGKNTILKPWNHPFGVFGPNLANLQCEKCWLRNPQKKKRPRGAEELGGFLNTVIDFMPGT